MLNKIKLTPHFTLAEMLATHTFDGDGVVYNCESLTPEIYNNLVKVCKQLEVIRTLVRRPLHINSGFRCLAVNNAVNGASKSDHLRGLAVDICTSMLSNDEIAIIIDFVVDNDDVRYFAEEFDKGYIHISFWPHA